MDLEKKVNKMNIEVDKDDGTTINFNVFEEFNKLKKENKNDRKNS